MAPAFQRSADFAIDKPAGTPCPNLRADDRCRIHAQLRDRGFAGCSAYDCFGAGQRVSEGARERTDGLFAVFATVRQLHELLWYIDEARELAAAEPLRAELDAAAARIDALAGEGDADPAAERDRVRPLLRRAAEPRGADRRGADLAGSHLRDRDLRGADLSGASLLGADLRGADLRRALMIGADLRGARLEAADLSTAIYLTQNQVGSATGDPATRIPARLERPLHWASS